jgi:hypothetical protein
MELMKQIDLLQELKVQLEFNRAGGQIGELLKRGEASITAYRSLLRTRSNLRATSLRLVGRPLQLVSPRIGQTLGK